MTRTLRNAWQHLPGTYLSELLAMGGVDVVTLDLQHGMITLNNAMDSILAIETRGALPFVRVPGVVPALIGSLLDAGAAGIICPTVESARQTADLVDACCYPPLGRRSCGPNRAILSYGKDYVASAADHVRVFAMIETVAGLEAIDEIAATAGLSGLFIGPGDLGMSMGLGGGQDRDEPEILEAISRVKASAVKYSLALGIHAQTASYAAKMAGSGFHLVTVYSDAGLLSLGAAAALTEFSNSSI